MRVIAGTLGGRVFDSPGTARTHPMSDKARGALFNVLGDIEGLRILDAFAGTGALSFEAVSRGAASALAIENDRTAQKTITRNITALGLDDTVKLVATSANAWLSTSEPAAFDILLCDPPYEDLQIDLIARLGARVAPDGLLVLSLPASTEAPLFEGFEQARARNYGDMQLVFYRKA